jgi:hypothetical protein
LLSTRLTRNAQFEAKQRAEAERKSREQAAHEQHVREAAKNIRFD